MRWTAAAPEEAIRLLEDLVYSDERMEEPLQKVIARYPSLLACVVVGGGQRYVIPKQQLGNQFVPDFLVLGVDSAGVHWATVEIEAARHTMHNQDGTLSTPTRHAVRQVRDWREWLTDNVAYAQSTLGLPGITNRASGLVIIGRTEPVLPRDPEREALAVESRIVIHSWDWLLEQARSMQAMAIRSI